MIFKDKYLNFNVNIFGPILKNKMTTMGISLSVMKSAYISILFAETRFMANTRYLMQEY